VAGWSPMARGKAELKAEKGARRAYSAARREEAVTQVEELGLTGSASKYGVPISTLFDWVKRAGKAEKREGGHPAGAAPEEVAAHSRTKAGSALALKRRPAKRYTPSQRAQILEDAVKDGPSAASEKHSCSRFAIYDWSKKVERAAAGQGEAPTSGPDLLEVEVQRDKEILDEWHRHPGLGPSQIRNQLRGKCVKVSVNTVRRVMEDKGYRPPKVERRKHDERFEAVRPNHMWHLDFVQRYVNRATTFTLILIDDHSRFVVGHGIDEAERADMVLETFDEAVRRHGRPELVMHDKGAPSGPGAASRASPRC